MRDLLWICNCEGVLVNPAHIVSVSECKEWKDLTPPGSMSHDDLMRAKSVIYLASGPCIYSEKTVGQISFELTA